MHARAVCIRCMQGLYVLDACKGSRYYMHARAVQYVLDACKGCRY